jgi:hypothetical protein
VGLLEQVPRDGEGGGALNQAKPNQSRGMPLLNDGFSRKKANFEQMKI